MNYLRALKENLNMTKTENGANALKSTHSALLDLFGTIGALRNRSDIEIENLFSKAFAEDRLLALKILFYARDVRGGLGERRIARVIYKHLARIHPDTLRKNLEAICHYGRWDDLLVLIDSNIKDDVIEIIRNQLLDDCESENPSLLAKWLPSNNTSSLSTRRNALILMKELNLSAKEYRQTLVRLRKKIDVLEVKMSSKNWASIDYNKVPSNAMNRYSKAFYDNDQIRFSQYIHGVKTGENRINASVLYPYDIIEKILYGTSYTHLDVLEQQWINMPDYVFDNQKNVMIMADVSGSMRGRPMATSIGLALYFAQRTKGRFYNYFMTFSESPSLIEITGDHLYEQARMVLSSNWGMNTNFEKALKKLLVVGKENYIKQSEFPDTLVVISDMQFDKSINNTNKNWSFYRKMKRMYSLAGYKIPEIVFWNVNSTSNTYQVSSKYEGVKLASGQSASVFASILNSKALTPYDFMLEVVNDERYNLVNI